MSPVVKYARSIKRASALLVAVLAVGALLIVWQQFRAQQQAHLADRRAFALQLASAERQALLSQLGTHMTQWTLAKQMRQRIGACLAEADLNLLQQQVQTRSRYMRNLSQRLVTLSENAVMPGMAAGVPRATITEQGQLQLRSQALLGQLCSNGRPVLQETETLLTPPWLLGFGASDTTRAHTLGHVAFSYDAEHWFIIRLVQEGSALFYRQPLVSQPIPPQLLEPDASAARRQEGSQQQKLTSGRVFALYPRDPQSGVYGLYYGERGQLEVVQFLRSNAHELVLLALLLGCILALAGFIGHAVDTSVSYHRSATRDFLTGLYNRRAALERAEGEIMRAVRNGTQLCVLQVDIDHFKRVNDTYGHDGGDQVLKFFADLLRQTVRRQDLVARIGGEEFLMVLPETDLAGAQLMAERLLQALRSSTVDYAGQCVGVTCSLGITAWRGAGDSLEALLIRGDQLLYQAKQQGRDRYVSDSAGERQEVNA